MKNISFLLFVAILLSACSTTQKSTAQSDTFEQDLKQAKQIEKNKRSWEMDNPSVYSMDKCWTATINFIVASINPKSRQSRCSVKYQKPKNMDFEGIMA